MNHLDINQIKDIIPHRHPFLLIDYIEDYVTIKKKLGSNWEERLMKCSEEEINKLFGEERFIFEEFTIE